MRPTTVAVAAFMLMPLGSALSQAVQPKSGDRVRITALPYAMENRIARVLSARNDTLLLDIAPAETLAVALANVSRLDVSTGRRRHTTRGAILGALLGVATGAIIGYASGDDPQAFFFSTAEEKALVGGAALGAIGVVVGALVGTAVKTDRWTAVSLRGAKAAPSFQIGQRRAGLAVAVAF